MVCSLWLTSFLLQQIKVPDGMRECIPIHDKEAFYRPRFERLLKALEEGQINFEETQHRLLKALQPLDFDAEILGHVPRFIGRQWVFDAVREWLETGHEIAS